MISGQGPSTQAVSLEWPHERIDRRICALAGSLF
jgi:hypothetical protein